MPPSGPVRDDEFTFEVEGYPSSLRVAGFTGTEELSQLFQFDLELAAEDAEIDFASIVGQPALLTIYGEEGERYVNGIVSRLEQVGEGPHLTRYVAELVPAIWLLNHRQRSRIFQNMTAPDIVKKVLDDAGIPSDQYRFDVQGSYMARDFCVQYRESELDFISRLMEEEGIFYFFEHSPEGHLLVFGDDSAACDSIMAPPEVLFRSPSGFEEAAEAISDYRFSQEVRPTKVHLRDYDFTRPNLKLDSPQTSDEDLDLEVYDYPGEYSEQAVGDARAQARMEELRIEHREGFGRSSCRRFVPGCRFTIDGHPRPDFNQEVLIVRTVHTASQSVGLGEETDEEDSHYDNEFSCISADVPFRPSRTTPKPKMEGVQTAIVVGPDGEEVHVDEHGRVKVHFHWDRDDRVLGGQDNEEVDKSSFWIRVSQLWAGPGWGAMFIPRIGQEVLVDFLEGDPDQPIIVGRVYHGLNTPPYPLPDEKTKSTIKSDSSKGSDGSNEIRFEDAKGSEEFYTHAQKDQNEIIENNMTTSVGANQTLTVDVDRTKTVKKNETTTVEENRTQTINGTHTETIKQDTQITITDGNYSHDVATGTGTYHVQSDVDETYDATQTTTVAQDITITSSGAKIHATAATEIILEVGASKLTMKSDGSISIEGIDIAVKGVTVSIKGTSITSQADADHNTKGAIVVSEGSATNTVKGAMVMLNP